MDDVGEDPISRRNFLRACVASGCALPLVAATSYGAERRPAAQLGRIFYQREARHWTAGANRAVTCSLCPRACVVPDGRRGYCGVRENRNGRYHTLVWGNPCALNVDPIEKKPLYHVIPGESAFSIGTAGCNMKCKFCQNWSISQVPPERTRNYDLPPAGVVRLAARYRCKAVALTYSEPTVFYEYMFDTATAARQRRLKTVVVSNGFISAAPMTELCRVVSAVKIDLKAFTEQFYARTTSARLRPVLDTLKLLKRLGMWFEIVNLIIPTLNDRPADIRTMCRWIKRELGEDVPLHFSAFHPMYRLRNLPRTPNTTMFAAYDIARAEGLRYVYVGNVHPAGHRAEKTYCPNCSRVVVDRSGYRVRRVSIRNGRCAFCGREIAGIWT